MPPVSAAPPEPVAPIEAAPSGHQVIAPMVGTYYASATPGAKPFVEIGTVVEAGDTLCIIEAMKMMNQIESEVAGRVVSILAENGNPVEYGQLLFVIED
jgi:acetyl-CoA carboxylase biotin carboxyl carrier protein